MRNKLLILFKFCWLSTFAQINVSLGDGSTISTEPVLEIPVVFHIVGNEDIINKYNDSVFVNIIEKINTRLKNAKNENTINAISDKFQDDVAKLNIKFILPSFDSECNPIKYISRHKSSKKVFHLFNDEFHLNFYGKLDTDKFLNIWICNIKAGNFDLQIPVTPFIKIDTNYSLIDDNELKNYNNIVGNTPYKIVLDGILLDIEDISGFQNDTFMVIHEIGHYFGLSHIWGGGCVLDDGISDTPPQKKSHKSDFNEIQDDCNGNGKTNHQNFMDYSYDVGMFTHEQKTVIRNYINQNKPGFLWKNKCKDNSLDSHSELTTGFIKDSRDNQSYKWVQVGNQKWMAENLNYKTVNSKCYNSKETNCTVYGRLYNWNDVINVCPAGWRIPNYDDWKQLTVTLENNQNSIRSEQGWFNNKGGTNSSGLNFLPSGYKFFYGKYSGLGKFAKIWFSNSSGTSAYSRDIGGMRGYDNLPQAGIDFKRDYLSCRCIQDINSSVKTKKPKSTSLQTLLTKPTSINEDFFIGEWKGRAGTFIFRKDKIYTIKGRYRTMINENEIWSYDGKSLILKRFQSTFIYPVEVISESSITLQGLGDLERVKYKRKYYKYIKKNVRNLNKRFKNQGRRNFHRKKKKKSVTLKDLFRR